MIRGTGQTEMPAKYDPAKYDNGYLFGDGPVGFVDGPILDSEGHDISDKLRGTPRELLATLTPWVRDRQKESTTIRVFNAWRSTRRNS
jgi:hypothetical protein